MDKPLVSSMLASDLLATSHNTTGPVFLPTNSRDIPTTCPTHQFVRAEIDDTVRLIEATRQHDLEVRPRQAFATPPPTTVTDHDPAKPRHSAPAINLARSLSTNLASLIVHRDVLLPFHQRRRRHPSTLGRLPPRRYGRHCGRPLSRGSMGVLLVLLGPSELALMVFSLLLRAGGQVGGRDSR